MAIERIRVIRKWVRRQHPREAVRVRPLPAADCNPFEGAPVP